MAGHVGGHEAPEIGRPGRRAGGPGERLDLGQQPAVLGHDAGHVGRRGRWPRLGRGPAVEGGQRGDQLVRRGHRGPRAGPGIDGGLAEAVEGDVEGSHVEQVLAAGGRRGDDGEAVLGRRRGHQRDAVGRGQGLGLGPREGGRRGAVDREVLEAHPPSRGRAGCAASRRPRSSGPLGATRPRCTRGRGRSGRCGGRSGRRSGRRRPTARPHRSGSIVDLDGVAGVDDGRTGP